MNLPANFTPLRFPIPVTLRCKENRKTCEKFETRH